MQYLLVLVLLAPIAQLPPPEDTPEEVLRAEIYTSARSPIDGRPLSAREYIEELDKLAEDTIPPQYYVSQELRELIELLRLRRLLRRFIPFIP